jgi:site-specific DNA-methyltransferase (adenine-specific)
MNSNDVVLYHGDYLELMRDLPDASVDLILCDLPYGTTRNKWDCVLPFSDLWREYERIGDGAIVLTASQPFTSALLMSKPEWFRYAWVWEKSSATGHLNAKRMPMKLHEDVLVFPKNAPPYNPQGLQPFNKDTRRGSNGTNFGASGTENFQEFTNYPRSILRFTNDPRPVHPTQKPIANGIPDPYLHQRRRRSAGQLHGKRNHRRRVREHWTVVHRHGEG